MSKNSVSKSSQFSNPFYAVLIVVGVAFLITACGYAVLAARGFAAPMATDAEVGTGQGFLAWMDQHGLTAMIIELILLAFATLAAIATDDYWEKRRRRSPETDPGDEMPAGAGGENLAADSSEDSDFKASGTE